MELRARDMFTSENPNNPNSHRESLFSTTCASTRKILTCAGVYDLGVSPCGLINLLTLTTLHDSYANHCLRVHPLERVTSGAIRSFVGFEVGPVRARMCVCMCDVVTCSDFGMPMCSSSFAGYIKRERVLVVEGLRF